MKKICVQCGKEFELTESELSFYGEKKLEVPKRCKDCRQANRRRKRGNSGAKRNDANKYEQQKVRADAGGGQQEHQAVPYPDEDESAKTRDTSGGHKALSKKRPMLAGVLACIGIALYTLFTGALPDFSDNADAQGQYAKENDPSDAANADEKENTGDDAAKADGFADTDGAADDVAAGYADVLDDAEDAVWVQAYTFRNEEYLAGHYEKHGIDMGYATAEEYLAGANRVVASEDALHKYEEEDNDEIYYLEATNEIVFVSQDGYIRTYFSPDAGIEYYNRQ